MRCRDLWRIPLHTTATTPVLIQWVESNGRKFPLDTEKPPDSVPRHYERNLHTCEKKESNRDKARQNKTNKDHMTVADVFASSSCHQNCLLFILVLFLLNVQTMVRYSKEAVLDIGEGHHHPELIFT